MPEFERNVEAGAFAVDDKVFKAFKEYVAANAEDLKLTERSSTAAATTSSASSATT